MNRLHLAMAIISLAAPLAACEPPPAGAPPAGSVRRADHGYVAPPTVLEARLQGPNIFLTGLARAGAEVRLATPEGEVRRADADGEGRWSIELPRGAAPRILGLSAISAGRQVQAEGYLLVAPGGQSALLRAGAGAVRLDPQPRARINAVDFDRDGGAVVSGSAPSGAALSLQVDGRQTAEGRADERGRYTISLPSPMSAGSHRLDVSGNGFGSTAVVEIGPAAPLVDGPFRSQTAPGGFRADWMTPGGGAQSTVIIG